MSATEADIAAQLIERLLADPAFRAKFRRNPAVACREAGLHELADEMSLAAGSAAHTLEMRESRSSLAGVMMAAAMEGMGVYEFSKHIAPAFEGIPAAVNDVLSRVNLPALPGRGALAGASPPAAPLVEPADGAAGAGGAADAAASGGGGGGGAAEAAAPAPPAATPEEAAATGKGADGKGGDAAADAAKAKEDPAAKAAEKIAQEESPEAKQQAAVDEGLADAKDQAEDLPQPTDLPSGPVPLHEAVPAKGGGGGDAAAAAAQPAAPAAQAPAAADAPAPAQLQAVAPEQAATAPAAAVQAAPSGGGGHVDPAQFGAEGTGGPPSPETEALLQNKNVVLDAAGIKDMKEGRIDPRIVSVLTKLSENHKITISATESDHPKFTTGGSVSNHHLGRGVDIAAIDGVPVSASNFDAREMASHLIDLDPSIRPSEIGSPFAIAGPAFFTDAAHQNHIHIGFDDPISPDFKPPADVAAGGGAAPAAVAPAAAAPAAVAPAASAPAPAAPPAASPPAGGPAAAGAGAEPVDPHKSGSFLSVKGAAEAQADDAKPRSPHDSQTFLKAVAPEQPRTPAAVQPGAPGAADAVVPAGDLSAVSDVYPGDDAPKEQIAAWMAKQAEARGLPRQLPVMAALVESSLTNVHGGDRDSVGFFQMRVGIWNNVEAYHGYPDKPELQVKWFLDQAEAVKKQRIANGQPIDDPKQFGEWIADVERPAAEFRGRYQLRLDEANGLLSRSGAGAAAPEAAAQASPAPGAAADAVAPAPAGGGDGSLGAAALKVAETQRGVHEIGGANRGQQVEEYLKAAQVGPGNPWCASFITWSLEQAGHKMPGSGWAAVATWVHNAEAGNNGLKVVSADEARPGDIVAYDFGHGTDFGADGHIGFLESSVKDGKFTALEGNNDDAVNQVPRSVTDANVKFLRIEGNAPASAAAPAAVAPGAVAAAAPGAPAAAAVPPPPVAEPIDPHKSGGFLSVKGAAEAQADAAKPRSPHESQGFLKAVAPEQPRTPAAVQPGAPAAADAVAPAADLAAVPDAYPGDSAPKAELAAWMAKEAEKRGLPHELPVMASLVESGLTNIQGGDRDSIGFFQMRTGIWNSGPYEGYPDKPELQIKWFLDQAEAVKKQRIANGQPIDDPKQYGEWIADVERPAEQFRGRYQLRLDEAQSLLKQAPETSGASPEAAAEAPGGSPAHDAAAVADAAPPPALATSAAPQALAAVKEAEKYLGTPYKYGGSTPQTGFDCSGLMQWAYAQAGIKIPRVTYTQIDAPGAMSVRRSELLPGDLVFFRDGSGNVHHVGMSLGGDKFIHAPHTGDVVKVSSLNERYYAEQFTGGRRFAQAVAGAPAPAAAVTPEAAAATPAAPAAPAAPVAPAAPAAPAIDPRAVAEAKAAAARDAAEARRHNSGLFMKIQEQETRKENERRNSMMFLRAIKPEEAQAAAAAPAPPPAEPAPTPPAPAVPAAADAAQPAAPSAAAPEVAAAATPADFADAAASYPGNDASQAQLAKWLADTAEKHGLPRELPVMASLVESGVKNLNFGDRDSVGFFQMRTEIWNKGEYAGYPDHPELQIKWFIDNALAVKRQRIAAGDANFGRDPSKWGQWIADVERPAEQFRGRYQLRLDEARELLS